MIYISFFLTFGIGPRRNSNDDGCDGEEGIKQDDDVISVDNSDNNDGNLCNT